MEEQGITLKDLIVKIQEYFWEVIRYWKWVLVITIPFVIFFIYKAFSTPPTYLAELTFMVNEDDGNALGGMSAILGQFGFGGVGGGKNNLDKILELAKSRRIVQEVLFEKISLNNKEDYIANHLIDTYDFHEEWAEDTTGLDGFRFDHDSLPAFSRSGKRALKIMYGKLIGSKDIEGLYKTGYDEVTGIMRLHVKTINESLSIQTTKLLYGRLSKFYVTKTVEKQQQTYNVMKNKVDSLRILMLQKESALAVFKDSNLGLYTKKAQLQESRLMRDIRLYNEMYLVSLKNFEIADFSLRNETPFIQLIDEPIIPLKPDVESKLRSLILGLFLGVFIAVLLIITRKTYYDVMGA